MYKPWAYNSLARDEEDQSAMQATMKQVDADHCHCPFGSAAKEIGYNSSGTSLDWVYAELKTPFSFVFEIYSDFDNAYWEERWESESTSGGTSLIQHGRQEQAPRCFFAQFTPQTREVYDSTVRNWAAAYLQTARLAAQELRKRETTMQL